MTSSKPNILFVLLDSACPNWLSCYNSPIPSSPHIDELAGGSLVFETAISPSSWTLPVMASVFTGMLPTKHGCHDQHQTLDSAYPTMAEIFSRHGYDTAAFADVPFVGPTTRLDRGFGTMSNLRGHQVTMKSRILKGIGRIHQKLARGYRKTNETPVVIGEAMHWLKHARDPEKPFLLYIHSDEPHAPFLPPARYRRRFTDLSSRRMHAINQDKQLYVGGQVKMTPQDFEQLRTLARCEVAYFDEWLGRLFDYLRRRKMLDDTMVVIAADHGDNVGEHGLLRHALCLYDTLLHVPLIIKPPGESKQVRIKPMVQFIDVLPTMLKLADIEDPAAAEFQGRDLMESIARWHYPEMAISELYRPSNMGLWTKKVPEFMDEFQEKYDRMFRSVRTQTHKYIWASRGPCGLYDLAGDPGETRNIADREPQLVASMQRKLDDWLASFKHADAGPASVAGAADEQVLERLRDLGYIE